MEASNLKEYISDAIRFWEPRRLLYNAVLAAIVISYFAIFYPTSKEAVSVNGVLTLFMMAVMANVAYCAAYVVDIFSQLSGYREEWKKRRWVLLTIGTLFASIWTRFIILSAFEHPVRNSIP